MPKIKINVQKDSLEDVLNFLKGNPRTEKDPPLKVDFNNTKVYLGYTELIINEDEYFILKEQVDEESKNK